MRSFLFLSGAVLSVSAALWGTTRSSGAGADAVAQAEAESVAEGLIVHEWGTFTSFSGSDGVRLEFRPLADEDLPPFVLDRFLQAGATHLFSKSTLRVRLRMETPVTYFYTPFERHVNVRVGFPEGLLTEFYPPVAHMTPAFQYGEQLSLKDSSLNWGSVHLIPADRFKADVEDPALRRKLESLLSLGPTPPCDANNHYIHARETDSALVHVHRPAPGADGNQLIPHGDFFEKFLFYRGVGNLDLPLELTSQGEDTFDLANAGNEAIRSLFLIETVGARVRFTAYDRIAAGERMKLVQTGELTTVDELAKGVSEALVREGLYEKEALAMVNTWRSSWFGEGGTRLLYIVPQSLTDAILPLEISPRPEKTVRVLVGRMEIMTPEQESQIEALLRTSLAERQAEAQQATAKGEQPNYAGPAELANLGRLAEPALARARAISKDAAIRAEARTLLQGLVPRR